MGINGKISGIVGSPKRGGRTNQPGDLSDRFGVPIIEDSPYRRLRYHGAVLPSLFSLDQKRGGGRVIGIYTFSKLFCPGMRIGFNIRVNFSYSSVAQLREAVKRLSDCLVQQGI
jgi:DNA-binding transcriptional MocR family regulator